jgi:hypothetical protein
VYDIKYIFFLDLNLMTHRSFVLTLGLPLLLAAGTSLAQNTSPASLAPGQAKTCSLDVQVMPVVITGRNGFCGKGSYFSFRMRSMTDFFIEQVCDLERPITRTPTGEEPNDDRVACFVSGEISEPARSWSGATVVMDSAAR